MNTAQNSQPWDQKEMEMSFESRVSDLNITRSIESSL